MKRAKLKNFEDIAKRINEQSLKTPFYYYDLKAIENRFQKLQSALTSKFKINYSMKANPHDEILRIMKNQSPHVDVASLGEIKRALAAGYSAGSMSFVGPGKSKEELEFAVVSKVGHIIVESFTELEILSEVARKLKTKVHFCVRVNPKKMVQANGKEVENKSSQFGIDQQQVLDVKNYLNSYIHFSGLHFYLQPQFLKAQFIVDNFRICADVFKKIQSELDFKLEIINFGGGFGIPYFNDQTEIDLGELSSQLDLFFDDPNFSFLKDLIVIAESGRYLVGPAGLFVTKVLYRKVSQNKVYLICDGGFSQHMAATGVGQSIRRNYRIQSVCSKFDPEVETVTIAGPSCYSVDILANDIQLKKTQIGDYIIIENSGAYGRSFSPESFLTRPPALEYT